MVSSAPNQSNEQFETLIRNVLEKQFGRKVLDVSLESSSNNTKVYILSLSSESDNILPEAQTQVPGTEHLPKDTTKVVMRFTDPGAYLNDDVQVQNEVAALALARDALKPLGMPIVPRVYGWSRPINGYGWVLEEHMPGRRLERAVFKKLGLEAKEYIVCQIGQILRLLQQYEVPSSIVGYGGLDFADDGQIITGPTSIHGATKACETYYELYSEYLRTQLAFMDKCDIVQGWKDTGLRARIDDFVARGFQPLLQRACDAQPRQTFVHGDFDIHNLLFDLETNQITALLDFSFSQVASVADEYFYSFQTIGALISPSDPSNPHAILRKCILHGFDEATDEVKTSTPNIDWDLAQLTNEAFFLSDVQRPIDLMPKIDLLGDLYWFIQNISPGFFFLPRVRANMGPERAALIKKGHQESLERTLSGWGF